MDKRYEKIIACRDYVRTRTDFVPRVALVLGSGLGGFAENLDVVCEVAYSDIPGFPVSTVPGQMCSPPARSTAICMSSCAISTVCPS